MDDQLTTNPSMSMIELLKPQTLALIVDVFKLKELKNTMNSATQFSEADSVSWRLSQYSREIIIKYCHALSYVIPCNAAGQIQKLQVLKIKNCNGMKEVFVSQEMNSNNKSSGEEGKGGTPGIPRLNKVIMLPNLKILEIVGCPFLKHIFTFSALESLRQLEELTIKDCVAMQVIVKKEEDVSSKEVVVFPRLKSIALEDLPKLQMLNIHSRNLKILELKYCESLEHIFTFSAHGSLRPLEELTISGCGSMKVILKEEEDQSSSSSKDVVEFPQLKSIEILNLPELEGFFLGMNEFRLPSLDNVKIDNCPKMMVFAPGGSTAPELKYIHTKLGKHSLECGLNFHVTHHQSPFPNSSGMPWSFHNLIELDVKWNFVKKIIPSSELLQLQKLEKIHVKQCDWATEVVEALEEAGRNRNSISGHGFDESSQTTTIVRLPNLTQVKLDNLGSLRNIWKSNLWTTFEFPNLTTLYIYKCDRLGHVFSRSMVSSLLQLQELRITDCDLLVDVIVKDASGVVEEESDGKSNEILVLPRLKSISLYYLRCFQGFSLGKEDFSFPLLDTLIIKECPTIRTFTKGNLATPKLKEIETRFGSFYAGENINSFIKIKQKEFSDDWDYD